jgi:hypothetical protein
MAWLCSSRHSWQSPARNGDQITLCHVKAISFLPRTRINLYLSYSGLNTGLGLQIHI